MCNLSQFYICTDCVVISPPLICIDCFYYNNPCHRCHITSIIYDNHDMPFYYLLNLINSIVITSKAQFLLHNAAMIYKLYRPLMNVFLFLFIQHVQQGIFYSKNLIYTCTCMIKNGNQFIFFVYSNICLILY